MAIKTLKTIEFGDFQTPDNLALQVVSTVLKRFELAETVIEPTCGLGNFLKAVGKSYSHIHNLFGWEINTDYIKKAKNNLLEFKDKYNLDINGMLPKNCTS